MDIANIINNLEKNNMKGYFVEKKEDVRAVIDTLVKEGDSVSVGGSMTLFECGIIDYLRSGKFNFSDRYVKGLTPAQIDKIYRDAFSADAYFCSTNALTEDGKLYNVDGNANRIAAIAYGPKKVIMVVGINKIVENIDGAVKSVKTVAAPKNCKRLSCKTYCEAEGHCLKEGLLDGCDSESRICCSALICGQQRVKDRINVIIVNEELGY